MVKVKNLHGTTPRVPSGCPSWKDYWKKKKGYWPKKCAAFGCSGSADVGAHVKKVDSTDNRWYIVPLCYDCNNDHDGEFYVEESMLVPVNDD